VRRDGERVRITAQLIRVQDQIHLWAENYDRRLPGILDIHGEIGAAIADEVKLKLIAEERRQLTRNVARNAEAHDQYLRGRYHYARFNLFDAQKAVAYFQKAIELDPSFGVAHCGLADALMVFTLSGDVATKEVSATAKSAIARALRLDPESAEGHTSDSFLKFWLDWDFKGAELAARRAIRLNENYSMAHVYLAHVFSNIGRYDEALATIQQAMVLDPLSLFVGAMRGQFLYHAGKDAESVEQFNTTLGMEPRFWIGQICAAKVYERLGMYSEALAACDLAGQFSGGNSEALSIAGYVHAVAGDRAKADGYIQQMMERKQKRYVPPYNVALVFAGLGEHETALQWLRQALEERDVHMPFLLDHKWDGMRGDERFQEIAARAGFVGL
jgi:tetratricopeptide (TPR) repeat protein